MVSHRIELQSPKLFERSGSAPILLERGDRRFMQNVLAELGDPARHAAARASAVKERKGGGFHLYQPVHRVFHLAVVGVVCQDGPQKPRLDPLRIESAGLVVRKVRDGQGRSLGELAWVTGADGRSRWELPELWDAADKQALLNPSGHVGLPFADPDPARRPTKSTGLALLDARIATLKQRGAGRTEAVSPLFPLPPQACAAAGETLLVGLVPTASRQSEEAPDFELPSRDELERGGFFPDRLTAAASRQAVPFPRDVIDLSEVNEGSAPKRNNPEFSDYVDFVREMLVGFDARGSSAPSQRLRRALQQLKLEFRTSATSAVSERSLYDHLVDAGEVLVDGKRGPSFRMPERWAQISAAQEAELKDAMLGTAQTRFSSLSLDRGRFGDRDASYVVRTYVRVRSHDGCAPVLSWSDPSPEFKIAPWFDSSPGPRPTIELPNPLRDGLGSIKPNVTFAVPSSISNVLGINSPEDLLGGKGRETNDSGLMWLCSFSIPIITICAFIILNILINLLNFVFWWMPFVKICIPIPKPK